MPNNYVTVFLNSNQFSSVAQSCPTLCNPMNHSAPGLPVHHQLPKYSDSRSLNWWCHPAISSSLVPFSSCLQSFSASQCFLMSQLFTSGGQSTAVSALASVLPVNIQDWIPLRLTGVPQLIGRLSLPQHHSSKALILWHSAFFMAQLSHPYMTTGKTIGLTFVGKVMSLLFNTCLGWSQLFFQGASVF